MSIALVSALPDPFEDDTLVALHGFVADPLQSSVVHDRWLLLWERDVTRIEATTIDDELTRFLPSKDVAWIQATTIGEELTQFLPSNFRPQEGQSCCTCAAAFLQDFQESQYFRFIPSSSA